MTSGRAAPADHHDPAGGFRNPWPHDTRPMFTGFVRWVVTRAAQPRRDRTARGSFPGIAPAFAVPRAEPARTSITWVGHATFLIQLDGLNVLTDPMWGERASPVRFAGPQRYMPPGIPFDTLPPIDLVLLSHDHYDHFDDETIRALARTHPAARWVVPLGLAQAVAVRGVADVRELDWWGTVRIDGVGVTGVPARHFSGRGFRRNRTLWCGWAIAGHTHRILFAGDTGWHPGFGEIARRAGPFDVALLPIGAYDPRWFMAPVHMNPEEAVAAFGELTRDSAAADSAMVGMHWGTFKLTDEPMSEPPERARRAWTAAGFPNERLWILAHGESRWL
jgi:N-acyl-phosphatidylethanolamine-hydrolysing phospholipase D